MKVNCASSVGLLWFIAGKDYA